MSDFEAFAEEIEDGMSFLSHHQILGAKWGVMNGPPYPLGSGDHSSSEKQAAAAAGVKVGKDSGKGSIENVKPRSKSPQTDEEKREAALDAARKGDKKKIAKYMDYLTREELQEAENRARIKDSMTRQEPGEKKMSKADVEKMEAIKSGDKEKVKQYADKMTYAELAEAMNKVNLTAQLNHVDPPPTLSDKIDKVVNKIGQVRNWAETGIAAYNTLAKVYNSTHPDSDGWPEIQAGSKQKRKEQEIAAKLANQAKADVKKELSDKEIAKRDLERAKLAYDNQMKLKEYQDADQAKRQKAADKEAKKQLNSDWKDAIAENKKFDKAKEKSNSTGLTIDDEPKVGNAIKKTGAHWGNKDSEYKVSKETQRLLDEAAEMDRKIMAQWNTAKTKKISDYDDSYSEPVKAATKSVSSTKLSSWDDDDYSYDNIFSDYNKSVMKSNASVTRAKKEAEALKSKLEEDRKRFDSDMKRITDESNSSYSKAKTRSTTYTSSGDVDMAAYEAENAKGLKFVWSKADLKPGTYTIEDNPDGTYTVTTRDKAK